MSVHVSRTRCLELWFLGTSHEAGGCTFRGDYGAFSGSLDGLANMLGYVPSHTVIYAEEADFAPYDPIAWPGPYQAGVHVPKLQAGSGIKLTTLAQCKVGTAPGHGREGFHTTSSSSGAKKKGSAVDLPRARSIRTRSEATVASAGGDHT